MTDQARAYLSLREQITQLRQEFGEDTAWHIVESAVKANIAGNKIMIHKVSNPRKIRIVNSKKSGEMA